MSQLPPGPPQSVPYGTPATAPQASGLGIASLVLGILALLAICVWFVSLPMAVIGIVLGIVSWSTAAKDPRIAKGMPVAGTVLNAIALLLYVIIFVIVGIIFAAAGTAAVEIAERAETEIAAAQDRQTVIDETQTAGDEALAAAAEAGFDPAVLAAARRDFEQQITRIQMPGKDLETAKDEATTALDDLAAAIENATPATAD
ncbi:MAG: DUF4190 domain-containing protein [Planctomycetota bacterium]